MQVHGRVVLRFGEQRLIADQRSQCGWNARVTITSHGAFVTPRHQDSRENTHLAGAAIAPTPSEDDDLRSRRSTVPRASPGAPASIHGVGSGNTTSVSCTDSASHASTPSERPGNREPKSSRCSTLHCARRRWSQAARRGWFAGAAAAVNTVISGIAESAKNCSRNSVFGGVPCQSRCRCRARTQYVLQSSISAIPGSSGLREYAGSLRVAF